MQHLVRTFKLLAWLAWLVPVAAWAQPTVTPSWVPVRPYPSTATSIPAPLVSSTATGGITRYTVSAGMATTQGTVYAAGTALATNSTFTPTQASQLTFVPAANFRGNAFFQYTATDANGTSGAVYYSIPVSSSSCGTANTNSLDFSRATQEDWKAHAAAPTNGTTTTSTSAYRTNQTTVQETLGNYTVTGNQFATNSTPYLLGQSLVWQLNSATNDPNAATSNTSTVTFTFSRPVNNLSLAVQDIDAGTQGNQGSDWVDELQLDGYATTAATSAIALSASNVGLSTNNTNTFANTNTVRGTAANTTADGTVTITFPSAVQKLVLTYRNTRAYTSGNRRLQDMGITSMSWCAQNDVQATFTSVPGSTTVAAGTTVSYTVQFKNNGVDDATNETRVVTLPAGATNVSTGGGTYNAATNTIDFGTVAAANGSSTSFTYSYLVPQNGGTFTNQAAAGTGATYSSTSPNSSGANAADDSNTGNNVATSSLAVQAVTVSGTVYDDVNYGGGTGRTYATANTSATNSGFTNNAIGRSGARVEFYDNNGAYVGSTTTGTGGTYSYNLPAVGSYTVRVVNSTVTSVRTQAANTTVLPVQTTVVGTSRVGGENPAYTDAAANSGSQTLASLSSGTVTPQSIYKTSVTTTGATGIDFGYNFDTVVNTNNAGQGSLSQFMGNANALGNKNQLAQSGSYTNAQNLATGSTAAGQAGVALPAGTESSIFMIPTGQLTNGVAVLNVTSALPQLTAANVAINGGTQTYNIGNGNDVLLGTGGTVGTGATSLSQLNGPEVQLVGGRANYEGISTLANNTTVRGLSIYGFSNNIGVGTDVTNVLIEQNVLGARAASFTDPGTTARTTGQGINLFNSDNGTVRSNLIGFNGGMGVWVVGDGNGANTNSITGNEIRGNALEVDANGEGKVFDGIELQGASTGNTVSGNLITANSGHGIDSFGNAVGGNTITGNTISSNGQGIVRGNGLEGSGLRIYASNNTTTISNNILTGNNGSGVLVENSAAKVVISQNSIYDNTRVGIDLLTNTDANTAANTYNGNTGTTTNVTVNSSSTAGGNALTNYPVITSAYISGSNLVVSGYSKAGATIELFAAQANTSTAASPNNLFGQGRTYLTTVTEGATSGVTDNNSATGQSYSGAINGVDQGSDTNANGFSFNIPLSSLPGGTLAAGTLLTSTATLSGATSEFSGNAAAVQALTGYVYEDVNYGGGAGRPRTATGAVVRSGARVELYNASGAFVAATTTDANGQYSFNAAAGTYTVRVVNSTVTSSRTGYTSALLPVQTYNGTTTRVGGENPAYTDAAANSGSQTLAALSSGTTTPESIASIAVTASGTNAGPDFGYNFDAVVNTNDSGQGSLRQFIANSNALGGETSLAQVYTDGTGATTALATGVETSIFMIPNGQAVAGQRAGLTNAAGTANFTTPNNGAGTAATITLASALPDVTGPATAIDGATQTRSTGDSNQPVATSGSESTGPEVLLNLGGYNSLTFGGVADQLLNMGVYNSAGANVGVYISSGATGVVVSGNTINNNGANLTFQSTNSATPSAATITNNVIRDSRRGNADGIELNGNNSNMTITGNQILRNSAFGIDFIGGTNANNTITNNTFSGNGAGSPNGTTAQMGGIGLRSSNSNNNQINNNTFTGNYGAGIIAKSGTTGNIFSQNSFSGNGASAAASAGGLGLAIDLMAGGATGDNGDSVTKNDSGDSDTGANGLINFPIIQRATLVGNTLTVTGLSRPNTRVELYLAADDPTHYGEGATYLTTITQPSSGTATAYSGVQADGLDQGSDTGAIPFTITYTPTAAQLAQLQSTGALLTSTATLATADGNGNFGTSEFSGNARVQQYPVPNDLTNVAIADNATTPVALNPSLSASAFGNAQNVTTTTANSIASYTILTLPASGTLYYNGAAVTAGQSVADPKLLSYLPVYGSTTTVSFTYTATDANGLTSTQHSTSGTISSGPAIYTIPVTAAADVTASLTGGTTLTAGQPTGYYTATYTNLGPDPASTVTQTVTLPAGATLTQAQKDALTNAYAGTTFPVVSGNQTISFPQQSALSSGASTSYRFAFTAPTSPGNSTLTATVGTSTSEGINQAPDQASLQLTTGALTDVQAAIVAANTNVAPGATATFTATFTNLTASQPAAGVLPTVQLIPNLTAATLTVGGQTGTLSNGVISFANGATYTVSTGQIAYPSQTLVNGSPFSSAIAFTMPAAGTVVGTASVTTTTAETTTTNNVASASISAAPTFDLTTALTGPSAVVAGSPVTLSVSTTNNGPQAVSGAVQTVQLPTGLTATGSGQNVFVSNGGTYDSNSGLVTFPALGSLPAGQMVGNTITFIAPSSSFKPVATVMPNTTGAGDTNTGNNVAYLNGAGQNDAAATLSPTTATGTAANVYATLSANAQIVAGNTQVTFTAGIGNAGPGQASNVSARLQLIPSLSTTTLLVNNQGGTLSTDGKTIGFPNGSTYTIATGMLVYANTPTLPSGIAASATATVTVPAGVGNDGQLLATMSVGSQTPDNVPADNVKSVVVTVKPQTDLATTLVGPTGGVAPGQPVSYTAAFTNNGPATAQVVAETVQLPANLTAAGLTVSSQTGTLSNGVISFTSGAAAGASYNTTTGLLTLPALASSVAGASQTFPISFPAPAQSYVVSSAISSATSETTLANNAASVATTVSQTADVAVSLAGPATAVAGNPVTYTLALTNNGVNTATNVVPTLQLPAGLTITAAGPGTPNYDSGTGLLTFPAVATLQAGVTQEYYATFNMPSPASGQIAPVATFTASSADNVASNNTASLTTSLAPVATTTADLLTTITPTGTTTTPGAQVSYTLAYRNQGAASASSTVGTATLPTGLGTNLLVGNSQGTYSANTGLYTFSNGATYDPATGLLSLNLGTLAPSTTANTFTVAFPAPAAGPLVVVSAITSATAETDNTNNRANSNITITPAVDLAATITGPLAALPGVPSVYTATFSNVGVSAATNVTPTTQLPTNMSATTLLVAGQAGSTAGSTITYPNGASYNTTTGLLTFPIISNLATGTAGAVRQSFTVTMPAAGTAVTATASYTSASFPSSDTNTSNNSQSITTQNAPLSLAPTAENIVNNLQTARGNTSNTNLAISPLYATDPENGALSYYVQSLPTSGTLYDGTTQITSIPAGGYKVSGPGNLRYQPASGFVGNAFFTYTAVDPAGVASNTALYTIPVAQDQSTTYTKYNDTKGGADRYATGDVLAQLIDPNTAVYNSSGAIYNAAGVQQANTSNGLATTGTNVALVSGTLPSGVDYDRATGRIYVSNAAALQRQIAATTYTVTMQTTDLNGGVNTVPVSFTIGGYPLPVELAAFTAQAVQNRDALLKWTTASELHNDHFELERSLDGTSFVKIGQVAGQGSKASTTDYAFTDAGIGAKVAAGQPVYYRLKQVDQDGTSSYSPVRTVSFTGSVAAVVTLFPNPAATATGLDLSALPATGTYQVLLLDATGRQVRQATLAGGQVQSLDLRDLASGTYSVLLTGQQANGSALRQVLRLIKE